MLGLGELDSEMEIKINNSYFNYLVRKSALGFRFRVEERI